LKLIHSIVSYLLSFIKQSWLKSVNNLLETLDTGVENVVENQADLYEDTYYEDEVGGQSSVQDILVKRGLLSADPEEEEADNEEEADDEEDENIDLIEGENEENLKKVFTSLAADTGDDPDDFLMDDEEEYEDFSHQLDKKGHNESHGTLDTVSDQARLSTTQDAADTDNGQVASTDELLQKDASEEEINGKQAIEADSQSQSVEQVQNIKKEKTVEDEIQQQPIVNSASDINVKDTHQSFRQPIVSTIASSDGVLTAKIASLEKGLELQKKVTKESTSEKNNAVKETRKLRRNLVKLNAELDSTERELQAQRTELERAAARMEKDRQRYKEEKDRTELSHKENLKAIADEHKDSVQAMIDAHAKQIHDMKDRVERAEEARMREGGDMSAELAEATERERDTLKKAIVLEEEKSSIVSQVSSLKTQIVGLESRIELIQQAAQSAIDQERDADDRLDAALSLHARQLSQRQARETELERTVADLGAALVASRACEAALLKNGGGKAWGNDNAIAELRDKLLSAKDEVEMLSNQLMIERQKAETLQRELQDVTDEQIQDTAAALARENEYEHRVSDLMSTISTLQLKQNFSRHSSSGNVGESSSETNAITQKLQKEVSSLSEDLIRQSAKLQHSSTEVQTLRNRLQSALSRAEIAEKAAQAQVFDIESNQHSNSMRQRNGTRGRNKVASIKAAFKLETGQGEVRESIGKVVDTIDIVAVNLGSYFRSDPFARAFFLLYLMILHLWAFFLVIVHAHGTLEPSSDVGPEQLLKHSYRHMEQANIP